MGGGVVDVAVVVGDVGIAGGDVVFDDAAPEPAGVHDVGFVDEGEPSAALAGEFEGDVRDPGDFVGGVFLGVEGAVGGGGLVAEVDAAEELSDEHEVDPRDAVGFEGG